jgi:hypothetical protein
MVAEPIVDALELVHIDEGKRERLARHSFHAAASNLRAHRLRRNLPSRAR